MFQGVCHLRPWAVPSPLMPFTLYTCVLIRGLPSSNHCCRFYVFGSGFSLLSAPPAVFFSLRDSALVWLHVFPSLFCCSRCLCGRLVSVPLRAAASLGLERHLRSLFERCAAPLLRPLDDGWPAQVWKRFQSRRDMERQGQGTSVNFSRRMPRSRSGPMRTASVSGLHARQS